MVTKTQIFKLLRQSKTSQGFISREEELSQYRCRMCRDNYAVYLLPPEMRPIGFDEFDELYLKNKGDDFLRINHYAFTSRCPVCVERIRRQKEEEQILKDEKARNKWGNKRKKKEEEY